MKNKIVSKMADIFCMIADKLGYDTVILVSCRTGREQYYCTHICKFSDRIELAYNTICTAVNKYPAHLRNFIENL